MIMSEDASSVLTLTFGCPVPDSSPNANKPTGYAPKAVPADGVLGLESQSPTQVPATTGRRKTVDRRDKDESPSELEAERRKAEDRRQSRQKTESEQKAKDKDFRTEQNALRLAQLKRKRLLAECEGIMSVSYDMLAMDDYPDNALVITARQDRDYWLLLCTCFGGLFFLGLTGLVNAWIAGSGLGLCFLSWVFAFSPLRIHFFQRPPLSALMQKRKEIEFRALNHIRFLEANGGLAWRCHRMAEFNNNLERGVFQGLVRFSYEGTLLNMLKSRKHIRLYLLFALEAQKAYQRMQQVYLKLHFKNLEQGWDDTKDDAEADNLAAVTDKKANEKP